MLTMPSDTQNAALLAHILAQTKANLDFLVSQNYITASDTVGITSKLAALESPSASASASTLSSSSSSVTSVVERARQLALSDRRGEERSQSPPKPVVPATRRAIPPPRPRPQQARALWDYTSGVSRIISLSASSATHTAFLPLGISRPLLPRRRHDRARRRDERRLVDRAAKRARRALPGELRREDLCPESSLTLPTGIICIYHSSTTPLAAQLQLAPKLLLPIPQ